MWKTHEHTHTLSFYMYIYIYCIYIYLFAVGHVLQEFATDQWPRFHRTHRWRVLTDFEGKGEMRRDEGRAEARGVWCVVQIGAWGRRYEAENGSLVVLDTIGLGDTEIDQSKVWGRVHQSTSRFTPVGWQFGLHNLPSKTIGIGGCLQCFYLFSIFCVGKAG